MFVIESNRVVLPEMANMWTERKVKADMGSGILTIQDCIDMYMNGLGYVVINAGKVMAVHTRKGGRHGKQQSVIACCGERIRHVTAGSKGTYEAESY